MNARNASKELRRATARRNHLANKIAESLSAAPGDYPLALVLEWEMATMRVYALENNLRPRECGAAIGEGKTNGTHIPAVENPGNREQGDAAPTPAPFPNTTQHGGIRTMNETEYCPTIGGDGFVVDCDHCPDRRTCKESKAEARDE